MEFIIFCKYYVLATRNAGMHPKNLTEINFICSFCDVIFD